MNARGIAVVDFETTGGFSDAATIQLELEKHFLEFSQMNRNVKCHAIYIESCVASTQVKRKR